MMLDQGRVLTVLGTHLSALCRNVGRPSNDEMKDKQVKALIAKGAEVRATGSAVILAGDFNTPATPSPLTGSSAGYVEVDMDASPTYPFNKTDMAACGGTPPCKIDYIFASTGLEPVSASVSVPNTAQSDHHPLMAQLRIGPNQQPSDLAPGTPAVSNGLTFQGRQFAGFDSSVEGSIDISVENPRAEPGGELKVRYRSVFRGSHKGGLCSPGGPSIC